MLDRVNGFAGDASSAVSAAELAATVWRLRHGDGTLIAPVLCLLPDGLIGGYIDAAIRSWQVRDGRLVLANTHGVVTAILDAVGSRDGAPVRFVGTTRATPATEFALERCAMPSAVDTETPVAPPQPSFALAPTEPRRNLVVLRANENSLHTQWARDISAADRTWDLCVSYYGAELPADPGPADYLAHMPEGRKYQAISALFAPSSPLWAYDFVWCPDDDLMTRWADVNRLFEICRRHRLLLAQPALCDRSFVSHATTRQNTSYALRFTRFVEVMCPLFSIEALRICHPTFVASMSGWGLDHVWPKLLGEVVTRFAIIDEVAVTHTRPVGGSYDTEGAADDDWKLRTLYGAPEHIEVVGGLLRESVLL